MNRIEEENYKAKKSGIKKFNKIILIFGLISVVTLLLTTLLQNILN